MARRNKTQENEMSDMEIEVEADVEVEAEEAEETEATPKVKKKHDLPDGWVTPTGLTHVLKERGIAELAPQQMYGYVKSGKDFPFDNHTDGRFIVPIEAGVEWVVARLAAAAERKAAREAKAAAKAEGADQPEVGGEDTPDVDVS